VSEILLQDDATTDPHAKVWISFTALINLKILNSAKTIEAKLKSLN
jgi:hypothetical protein